jgi:hypothetical protein
LYRLLAERVLEELERLVDANVLVAVFEIFWWSRWANREGLELG